MPGALMVVIGGARNYDCCPENTQKTSLSQNSRYNRVADRYLENIQEGGRRLIRWGYISTNPKKILENKARPMLY